MSRYILERLEKFEPYTVGEQPKDNGYIKLNTNESPYFPSEYAVGAINETLLKNLRLYSDPESSELVKAIADYYEIKTQNVMTANGSDEILAFAFAGLCGEGAVFPGVTYGFYKVFAGLFGVAFDEIPLKEDFTVNTDDYLNVGKTVVLANPNAQTGIYLPLTEIEKIVKSNPSSPVVIDEAYVDFGGESAVSLIGKYGNLAVVRTFSKSRSLAGARVGFVMADERLIDDFKRVKYSFNPYNVNGVSALLAANAIKDEQYFKSCTDKIISTRGRLISELELLGFKTLPSLANFVLAEHSETDGKTLYEKLKERGILVRRFGGGRINNFVRITVGSEEQIDALLKAVKEIIK